MASKVVAIVTGGTRGIGSAIASALAEAGHDLLLNYNSSRVAAEEFVSALKAKHENLQVQLVGGDISEPSSRDTLFAALDAEFGSHALRAVVHNAGQYVGVTSTNSLGLEAAKRKFGDGSMLKEEGRVVFDLIKYYQRLYGDAFIDLCERGIARMHDGGSLIGISSPGCNNTMGVRPGYDMPGCGKCVMEYAMRQIAFNAGPKNINCNVVVPGVTVTDGWSKVAETSGTSRESIVNSISEHRVPMKRTADPKVIGDVVAFLCSDKGRYVTGVSLPVDGGLHLK